MKHLERSAVWRAASVCALFALLIAFMFAVGVLFAAAQTPPVVEPEQPPPAEKSEEDAELESLAVLSEALARVQSEHYSPEGIDRLVEGAIRGMLRELDPYSQYYNSEAYSALQTDTSGKFGGLGMYIGIKQNRLTVIAPIEDTPAHKAGVMAGDAIVEIDGESTAGISVDEGAQKMRGEPGTSVTLTILREGVDEPIVTPIVRGIITIVSVKSALLEESMTGYIRITQFMGPTAAVVEETIQDMEAKGAKALILDLRSNPGGLLNSATKIASFFLNEGDLIVYTKGRGEPTNFHVESKSFHTDLPLIVLVNQGSASASEIVAGALQAHGRALLMGTDTFGKASVQKIFQLNEAREPSAVKLTIAHYYTPNDVNIHKVGIVPDVTLDPLSGAEGRMWLKARSSEALKAFLEKEGTDVLERLAQEDPRDSPPSSLERSYRSFLEELEAEGIALSDPLVRFAIAVETVGQEDDYIWDPKIRSAVNYLQALKSLRRLRGFETPE